MQQRPHRVFAYTRVSSDEQERSGTSLPAQRAELVAYCERRGWPAPTVIAEVQSGSSEKLEERVELQRMLRDARAGDAIVVARVDRWTRDMPSGVQYVRDLVKRGVGWFSAGESIDASEQQGDSTLGMLAWASDNERKNIRIRTLGARRRMRNDGCWTEGMAPFGYRRDPVSRHLVVVSADAEHVREMFRQCIKGASIADIVDDWNDREIHREGGAPIKWHKKGIHSMLRARWYIGEIRNTEGVWCPAHEAIVDRPTFDRASEAMKGRSIGGRAASPNSRTAAWLLRGLMYCGKCGARMGAAYGPKRWPRDYYACAGRARGGGCDQPYARVPAVDEVASGAIVGRLEELCELLATQDMVGAAADDVARMESLRRSVANNRARRERLVSLAVDGAITSADLRTRVAKLDADIHRGEASLADAEAKLRPITQESRAAALRETNAMRMGWEKMRRRGMLTQQREVVEKLTESISIEEGELSFRWTSHESLCEAAVGKSLNLKTINAPLNRLRKAGVR